MQSAYKRPEYISHPLGHINVYLFHFSSSCLILSLREIRQVRSRNFWYARTTVMGETMRAVGKHPFLNSIFSRYSNSPYSRHQKSHRPGHLPLH